MMRRQRRDCLRQTRSLAFFRLFLFGPGLLMFASGCSLREALQDGFFGGISDSISTTVSAAILGVPAAVP